jgi:hypothetical protein
MRHDAETAVWPGKGPTCSLGGWNRDLEATTFLTVVGKAKG